MHKQKNENVTDNAKNRTLLACDENIASLAEVYIYTPLKASMSPWMQPTTSHQASWLAINDQAEFLLVLLRSCIPSESRKFATFFGMETNLLIA